jgi:hypothetical protein
MEMIGVSKWGKLGRIFLRHGTSGLHNGWYVSQVVVRRLYARSVVDPGGRARFDS